MGDTALLAGETAVVVERENAQALASGLASLMRQSAEQREALGKLAQLRVSQEFSIERAIERTVAAYALALKAKA